MIPDLTCVPYWTHVAETIATLACGVVLGALASYIIWGK